MKAIVCVKQVPDTSGKVAVKPDGTMDRASMATITNPDDLNAVEAALKLKDATGCRVTAISMGPPPAMGMLKELKAMGVDEAVLVSGREFGGSDTFATSQIIAAAIKTIGVEDDDIIFCGRQAIDGDTAQVGPQIAEKLGLPQVSYVSDIQLAGDGLKSDAGNTTEQSAEADTSPCPEGKAAIMSGTGNDRPCGISAAGSHITLKCRRMLEDGYMTVEIKTPCLLTCIKELNEPRYMTVKGILECDNEPVKILDYNALKDDPLIESDTIGLKGSPTNVFRSFSPPLKGAGKMLSGSDKEMVNELFTELKEKHIV